MGVQTFLLKKTPCCYYFLVFNNLDLQFALCRYVSKVSLLAEEREGAHNLFMLERVIQVSRGKGSVCSVV